MASHNRIYFHIENSKMDTSRVQDKLANGQELCEPNVHVALTHEPLDPTAAMSRVKGSKAGAVVLFAGT